MTPPAPAFLQPGRSAFEWAGPTGRPWPNYPGQILSHTTRLYGPNGEPGPIVKNPAIDGVRHFDLLADRADADGGRITIPANGQANMVWRIPAAQNIRGDLEIFEFLGAFSDHRFTCRGTIVGSTDRRISNAPIPANCLWGTGQWPHEPAETSWAEALSTVQWELFSYAPEDLECILMAHGRQFYNYDIPSLDREALVEAFQQRRQHIYYMTWNRPEAATGGISLTASELREADDLSMDVPGDGDFVCFGFMDDSDGPYELTMTSGRGGAIHSTDFVQRELFAGITSGSGASLRRAASNPRWLRQPHLFNRQTSIRFRIRNLMAETNVIRLVFMGLKSYAPELDKKPIELIGKHEGPRPLATPGSGNWQAMDPSMAGPNMRAPTAADIYRAGWSTPG